MAASRPLRSLSRARSVWRRRRWGSVIMALAALQPQPEPKATPRSTELVRNRPARPLANSCPVQADRTFARRGLWAHGTPWVGYMSLMLSNSFYARNFTMAPGDVATQETWLGKWHLIRCDPWETAIEKALAESETSAVFVGPSGLGNPGRTRRCVRR